MSTDAPRAPTDDPPSALARGTRLGEFEVRRVLGIGGFGIVYLAFDHALEREVAVKEYLPAALVGRTQTMHVSLRSESDAETFASGLRSFVNEARLLARFDHPSLLKVLRFWEANGTAYMAMPVLRGQTLKQWRDGRGGPPDEATLRGLLVPLLEAIERLHGEGVYHRDISPDNIQLEADGRPVLLDFGAARRVLTDRSHTLTAILKPAYAPIEQYAEVGSVRQGPWTDLYSLGATLHYLLLGRAPMPATARSVQDDLPPLAGQPLPGCGAGFLRAVDWMLSPRPADRPQSVAELRAVLEGRAALPQRRSEPLAAPPQTWDRTVTLPSRHARPAAGENVADLELPLGSASPTEPEPTVVLRPPAPAPTGRRPRRAAGAQATEATRRGRRVWIAALVAGAAIVVGWAVSQRGATPAAGLAAAPAPSLEAPSDAAAAPSSATAAEPAPLTASPAVVPPAAARASAPRAAPTAQPGPGTARPAEAEAASRRPERPESRPAERAVAVPAEPRAPERGPAPAPDAARPTSGAGGPAAPARAPAAEVPAAVTAGPGAAGPGVSCSGRNPLAYFVCMERECLRSALQTHPDCLKWRANKPQDSD